jgi:hypothetical protein
MVKMVGYERSLQAASDFLVFAFYMRLDELAIGEFGVQSPATSTIKKTGAQLIPSCAPAFLIFYLPKTVGYVNFSDPINPTTPGKE